MKKSMMLFIYRDMLTNEVKKFSEKLPPFNEKLAYIGEETLNYEPMKVAKEELREVTITLKVGSSHGFCTPEVVIDKGLFDILKPIKFIEKVPESIQITKESMRIAYNRYFNNKADYHSEAVENIFEILSQGAK